MLLKFGRRFWFCALLNDWVKGLRSAPRDAILAASTETKTRGRGFGIHRAMDSGGSVLGAIVAFILFWSFKFSFRNIFLIAGIISFISLIPLVFVKEKCIEQKTMSLKIRIKSLPKPLKLFMAIATSICTR